MKTIELDPIDRRFVQMMAALGNPARFKMLQILSTRPACIVGDIVDELPLAQATVSQHLRVLKEAGLIYGEQAGAGRCCHVAPEALAWLRERAGALEARLLSSDKDAAGLETS
jgi:ArsR family transcriptional regulator